MKTSSSRALPFELRFDPYEIDALAQKYVREMPDNERVIADQIAPRVRQQGYLDKDVFLFVCEWKTPRHRQRYASNDELFSREVTTQALSVSQSEEMRIKVLRILDGVDWPVASVILHWFHKDPYPLLDYRALESLGVCPDSNSYNFEIWQQYTSCCRKLARDASTDMRTLDRAMWQFSKDNPIAKSELKPI